MIKPTVGRVVWYYRYGAVMLETGEQPEAAIIAHVHDDRTVNLAAFDRSGMAYPLSSVQLLQDNDGLPGYAFCTWMPYQLGQAKTEAVEKELTIFETAAAAREAGPEAQY